MSRRETRPTSSGAKRSHAGRPALRLEWLEDRSVPATITVTGTGDTVAVDGVVTLREAITSVNQSSNVNADVVAVGAYATNDTITFNIAGAGVKTISPTSALPLIVKPVTIDGYSQAGASVNTLANADNAVLLIELNGTGAGAAVDGLTLGAGSGGSTIRGLVINRFGGNGIVVQSNGNTIVGNFAGVDPTGTTRMPNGTFPGSGDGIRVANASNNMIGTTAPGDRNIASGNAIDGIHVVGDLLAPATGNMIQNNFVGVAADGKSSVGNRTEPAPAPGSAEGNNLFGIEISGGNNNVVGGTAAGARNVVGLNGAGIEVDNGGQSNVIQGNYSGVGADGVTPAGNLLHGIVLRSSNGFGAPLGPPQANEPGVSNNLIGGTAAGAGNLVAFNGTGGIAVFGNPVAASNQPNVGNAILGNSVFLNGRSFLTASSAPLPLLGIDLTNGFTFPRDDGATPNDSQGHGGPNDPNNFQNFPVLTSVTTGGGMTNVTGTLSGAPNTTFRIEFFDNGADPLGLPAEGQQFLGFANVTTNASGTATISASFSGAVVNGDRVTATATDGIGNTSEFSAGLTVPTLAPVPPVPPVPPSPPAVALFAVSTDGGVPATVFAYNADGTPRFGLAPYSGFAGRVTVAVGDVNGDGVADVITGAGAGGTSGHVKVFDGTTGQEIRSFFAFPNFAGGVVVAGGDLNGDGKADIIVGAASGSAGGHVKVFDGATGQEIRSFFAFPGWTGAITLAAGDVNGDSKADIIVGASGSVGGHVKVFSGTDGSLLRSFFSINGFVGEIFLGAGTIDGDTSADIVVGTGPGTAGGFVKVFSGADGSLLKGFSSFNGSGSGVRVAAADLNGDGRADIIVGSAGSVGGHVKVFDGTSLALLDSFLAFPGYTGGVFVG